jgi:hypothetical protein
MLAASQKVARRAWLEASWARAGEAEKRLAMNVTKVPGFSMERLEQ